MVARYRDWWAGILSEVLVSNLPQLPPPKSFTPKHQLPILKDYRRAAPEEFWEHFNSNYVWPAKSLINAEVLEHLALEVSGVDRVALSKVIQDLRFGAKVGCKGLFRNPSKATNAPSAFADGEKVSDAICDWVAKGFVFGPVDLDEVPESAKFSGIMTRAKPNGSVRVILNLSSPKGAAVNEGIDAKDFPAIMSSTTKWVQALNKAGRACKMAKVDYADAYKHVSVHQDDLHLQWFKWLGRAFCELCLVFGSASSAGIFDRAAKIILWIVIMRSGIDKDLVIQHLDDCCAAGPKDSFVLERFDSEFFAVAQELGIQLAPRNDPLKAFGPSTSGVVLGVYYDTVSWIWAVPEDKFIRLLHDMKLLLDSDIVEQVKIWSIVGKIIHIRPLVPSGRFNMYHLILANGVSSDPKFPVPVSKDLKRQVWFWFCLLQVCSGRVQIPNLDLGMPTWTIEIFTDAAGGSCRDLAHGVGVVSTNFWTVLPWGAPINKGWDTGDGRKLDRIMSALELFGPLLAISAAHRFCRGATIRFWVDNSGSVYIWKKGYSSSCKFSTVIVAATAAVAAAIGCRVEVSKITRCSDYGSMMADDLSKGAMNRFWDHARFSGFDLPAQPLPIPSTLLKWVNAPSADFGLADALLKELALDGELLSYSF